MPLQNTIHALRYNTNVIKTYVYRHSMLNPTGVPTRNDNTIAGKYQKVGKGIGRTENQKKKSLQTAYNAYKTVRLAGTI